LDRSVGAPASPTIQNVRFSPSERNVVVESSDSTAAAAAVSPAVVTISTSTVPMGAPLDTSTGIGSGVIYSFDSTEKEGWILTNRHVVCGAGALTVRLADGRQFAGTTYGVDNLTDLAIVRITDAPRLPVATIGDSAALKPGQIALAIGSSLGTLTTSVTSGVVSALGRDLMVDDACGEGRAKSLRNLIQTDAAINPGNSGGALVNSLGDVIGINTAVAGGAQGIGFAVPINIAKPIMQQALDKKQLTRPWLGVTFVPLDAGVAQAKGLPIDHGDLIQASDDGAFPAIWPGSPAEAAGLREGDIITAIDDQRIDSTHSMDDILAQYRPEAQDPIVIWVFRDGAPKDLLLTLEARPADAI
ncbi:MAG: trypsin-like peptidase domain-containing protein, partial [Chloroflexi bacterium]|nr:trypsin-like peptidase domain-containing protein [Chloroflexota bacterium]